MTSPHRHAWEQVRAELIAERRRDLDPLELRRIVAHDVCADAVAEALDGPAAHQVMTLLEGEDLDAVAWDREAAYWRGYAEGRRAAMAEEPEG